MLAYLGQLKEKPEQPVLGALLDLGTGFPSRQCRFGEVEVPGQFFLGKAQSLPVLPDLLRRQQSNFTPQGFGDPTIGPIVKTYAPILAMIQSLRSGTRAG